MEITVIITALTRHSQAKTQIIIWRRNLKLNTADINKGIEKENMQLFVIKKWENFCSEVNQSGAWESDD